MEINKTNLIMLLWDSYQYHSSMTLDKNRNDELIKYHNYKMYEITRLIQEIKENDKITIKNDYK